MQKRTSPKQRHRSAQNRGFTLIELLVVIAIIAILASLLLPALAKAKDRTQATIDLNNVKQIVLATSMFTTDNNEMMPHPTWGEVPSGPIGWAYDTSNRGRIPGAPSRIPNLRGSTDYEQIRIQKQFFKIGQLGPYLDNPDIMECPKDVVDRGKGEYKTLYAQRHVKITSYTFSGALAGYAGNEAPGASRGEAYKITSFQPMDIFVWETDEMNAYNFNDAGNNVANQDEGISQRHAGATPRNPRVNVGGGAIVGRVGGTAHFAQWTEITELRQNGGRGRPNEWFCGPGFQ